VLRGWTRAPPGARVLFSVAAFQPFAGMPPALFFAD